MVADDDTGAAAAADASVVAVRPVLDTKVGAAAVASEVAGTGEVARKAGRHQMKSGEAVGQPERSFHFGSVMAH